MTDARMCRFLGLTWCGWLNVLLQFTGFRLARDVEPDGTVTSWALRWMPIWRCGWLLPTWRRRIVVDGPCQPDAPLSAAGVPLLRTGTILVRCTARVRPGDTLAVDDTGTARPIRRARAYRTEGLGTFVAAAPAGGVAPLVFNGGLQDLKGWPADQPPRYNGSAEACDMWTGPCACGAWHREGV